MGEKEDRVLEGSKLGKWWKREWTGSAQVEGQRSEEPTKEPAKETPSMVPSQELEVASITTVVPRPRAPAKSAPIDIPKKVVKVPPPTYVPEDKRYWYQ